MHRLCLAIVVLVSTGCAYHSPTGPTPPSQDLTTPSALQVNVSPGVGRAGGTATITATVSNRAGTPLASVPVTFSADVGTITPASAATNEKGIATATMTGPAGAARVTAKAGSITSAALVAIQPVPPPVPTSSGGEEPTPTPVPPPAVPTTPLTVQILVTPAVAGSATGFGLAINSAVTSAVWDFGDTTSTVTTTGAATSHVYAAGSYTASVVVTDDLARTASAQTGVVIANAPAPPPPPPPPAPSYTVTLSASPSSLVVNDSATLTAAVTQNNGAPAATSYAWDCDGNGVPEVTNGVNTHICAYPSAGTIASKVAVSSTSVTAATGSTSVTVAAAAPLLVAITANTATPPVGAAVTFTATVTSTGAVPATLQWEWDDDNDGTYEVIIPSAANPNQRTTSYGSIGVKTVKVRVTDTATGRVTTGMRMITVS